MTSTTGNQQSIIIYKYMSSPVKPKFGIQLLDLTHSPQESYLESELGTAQPQLVATLGPI
jgi:hypothetical protein